MQEKLLNDELRAQISSIFISKLAFPVELMLFLSKEECSTCNETRQLVEELVELSSLLSLKIYDIEKQRRLAERYHIYLAPALVITGVDDGKIVDYGIRFFGIPSGYEFSSLIHTIGMVSKRDSGLKPEIRRELLEITTPITLKVFSTPT